MNRKCDACSFGIGCWKTIAEFAKSLMLEERIIKSERQYDIRDV